MMPQRAPNFYFVLLCAAALIGTVTVYYAVKVEVVDWGLFLRGLIIGLAFGSLAGVISVKGLQKRVHGNFIKKLRGWELAPYIVLIVLIVFYKEIGSLFCQLFTVAAPKECLSRMYGVFYGVLCASFLADLLWVIHWEYRHREPLYFE